jgi:hypothetical protein
MQPNTLEKDRANHQPALLPPRISIRPCDFSQSLPYDYYKVNLELPNEIVEGVIREKTICALVGGFNMGKTPCLLDLAFRLLYGIPWHGKRTTPRPVVVIDGETEGSIFKRDVLRLAHRFRVAAPEIGHDGLLEPYLRRGHNLDFGTRILNDLLEPTSSSRDRMNFLREVLARKSDALIVIDPSELFFQFDRLRPRDILDLYHSLYRVLADFPSAAFILSLNLRKRDRKAGRAELATQPHEFLEETSGSLDLMNRVDVRLALDYFDFDGDVRVIGGAIRGAELKPMFIEPYRLDALDGEDVALAGFVRVRPQDERLIKVFTPAERDMWSRLPGRFKFMDLIRQKVGARSTLSRTLRAAEGVGLLRKLTEGGDRGVYEKTVGTEDRGDDWNQGTYFLDIEIFN